MKKLIMIAVLVGLLFSTGCETLSTGEKFIGYKKTNGGIYITNIFNNSDDTENEIDLEDDGESTQGGALSPSDSLNGNAIPVGQ